MPWYTERKARLIELIWNRSKAILAFGSDVILELGLIQRDPRLAEARIGQLLLTTKLFFGLATLLPLIDQYLPLASTSTEGMGSGHGASLLNDCEVMLSRDTQAVENAVE